MKRRGRTVGRQVRGEAKTAQGGEASSAQTFAREPGMGGGTGDSGVKGGGGGIEGTSNGPIGLSDGVEKFQNRDTMHGMENQAIKKKSLGPINGTVRVGLGLFLHQAWRGSVAKWSRPSVLKILLPIRGCFKR